MYSTPRAKRRLFATPASSVKRVKFSKPFTVLNKRTVVGPSRRGTLKQQVKSLQKVVRALAPELKVVDVSTSISNLTNAGTVIHLTQVAQGSDVPNRIGNSINLRNIALRMNYTQGSDATAAAYIRYAVVQDTQQISDTSPVVGDVFSSANPQISLPVTNNRGRFRYLHVSKPITVNMVTNGTTNPYWEFNWKGNSRVDYNGTASTDQQKNAVYLIVLTDSAASTMDFIGTCRLQFTDD